MKDFLPFSAPHNSAKLMLVGIGRKLPRAWLQSSGEKDLDWTNSLLTEEGLRGRWNPKSRLNEAR
jgi:hypothetical protein